MADEPVVGVVPNFSEGRERRGDRRDRLGAPRARGARRLRGGRPRPPPTGHDRARRAGRRRRERDGGCRGGGPSDRHVRAPRRSSADGRGRRDPVHAGARRDDGRVRRARTGLRHARWRRRWTCRSTCTTGPRCRPSGSSLAEVRKGEFEGLRDAVARGERLPDFGPHAIGRAGATAVGRPEAARGVQRLPRRHRRGGGQGDRARRARVVGRPARRSARSRSPCPNAAASSRCR